jgi:hypothetical protein
LWSRPGYASKVALDQLYAEEGLEVLQAARESRLRDVQGLGRAAEAAVVCDGDEGLHAEGIDLHAKYS